MGVKFLSEEWARAVQDTLNTNESFRSAAGSHTARIQQVVTTPEGERKYWFSLDNGNVTVGLGETGEDVDATITQDYETAVALSRNELSPTAAYMSGKLRVAGDLMKLMQMTGVLGSVPAALQDLEVDY